MNNKNHILGKFCSVAKPGTVINPKEIPGYNTPEGQILKDDGQQINFIYTPIKYEIEYDLDNGVASSELKKSYTVEDKDYTPESPSRIGYMFNGWEPKNIPHGNIGNVKFIATWIPNAILISGKNLNKALSKLAGGNDKIMGIYLSDRPPIKEYINISSTNTPILAFYEDGFIYIYSKYPIYCNSNMNSAFENFTILRNISALSWWICDSNTSIKSIFKNCKLLSNTDDIDDWGDGKITDFADAFIGTSAMEGKRLPYWYKWNSTILYQSISGKSLGKITGDMIPGEIVLANNIDGYKSNNTITINKPNGTYKFEYTPIEYDIKYILNDGELLNAKNKYTIEDEAYYPPNPVKAGYKFIGWDRECISGGEIGNVVFIAQYKSI